MLHIPHFTLDILLQLLGIPISLIRMGKWGVYQWLEGPTDHKDERTLPLHPLEWFRLNFMVVLWATQGKQELVEYSEQSQLDSSWPLR